MVVFGLATRALSCTYDLLGDNIETISEGGVQRQKYWYDSLNQLIREDNLDLNKTIVYSYDLGGNLTNTEEYAYQTGATVTGSPTTTNTYTYGDSNWKDKLTAYNGNTISYDAIGNPLSYYNGFTFTWQKGRQLASATNGTTSVTYTYNNDGYRTAKTINGTTTDYTLEGDRVLIEKTGSDYVWFYYDAAGAPVAMATGSGPSLYIYRKNLQGDITGIYSGTTGTLLVSYVYDAWGKVTATNVANTTESSMVLARNPYLYRGYRYDSETGLYYVSSRYYDPEICRWINVDDAECLGAEGELLSYNLFAYCLNNPVNRTDVNGNWSLPNWAKVAIGAVAIAGLAVATVCTGGAAAVICGAALSGAIAGGASGAVIGAVGGGISGGWQGAIDGACSGFMSGTLIGGVTGAASAGLNIATGATTVVGNAHGSTLHKLATNMEAGKMAASGQYSQIGVNKALKTMGLKGTSRPDVIGVARNGMNKLVEVVSPRQSTNSIISKMSNMLSNNPRSVGKIVTWVRRLFE